MKNMEENKIVCIKTKKGRILLREEEIAYCFSENGYSNVFTLEKDQYCICATLSQIEKNLSENFIRVHQSYLINLIHIREYVKGESLIVLSDGIQIPVSSRKRKSIEDFFSKFDIDR